MSEHHYNSATVTCAMIALEVLASIIPIGIIEETILLCSAGPLEPSSLAAQLHVQPVCDIDLRPQMTAPLTVHSSISSLMRLYTNNMLMPGFHSRCSNSLRPLRIKYILSCSGENHVSHHQ